MNLVKFLPALLVFACSCIPAFAGPRPVLLYSRAWNAEGETRYQPDGSYSLILGKLREQFDVRISAAPVTTETLAGVNVIVIANPSDKAIGANPPPRHLVETDRKILTQFIKKGGGLILMGNQENHNLETVETNRLLAESGLKWEDRYTDIKGLTLSPATPVIGGLKWGYYSGNTLVLDAAHPAKPQALVTNDVTVPTLGGTRNEAGVLMATATPGAGRVVAVTDAGWIGNSVLEGKGIAGFVVPGDQNVEIFLKLAHWAAGK